MANYASPYLPSQGDQQNAWQGQQSLIGAQYPWAASVPGYVMPQARNQVAAISNNPFAQLGLGTSQAVSNIGSQRVAPQLATGMEALGGAAGGLTPLYTRIMQSAFDPQQALYNRTSQQVQDQTNAINSMYGLGSSPYGAGVAGQTMANFNIDWQNNQLARMMQGIQGLGSLAGTQEGLFQGADQLGQDWMNTEQTAGLDPYNTYLMMQEQPLAALASYEGLASGAMQPGQAVFGELGGLNNEYLAAIQAQNQAAELKNKKNQGIFGGLGQLIGMGGQALGDIMGAGAGASGATAALGDMAFLI